MSFDRLVEDRIKEAMDNGEFNNLRGKGKPLDLGWYFDLPEDLRMGYSVLKSANVVPEEAQLLKDIARLKERLETCADPAEKRQLNRSINEKQASFRLLIENRKRK